MDRGSARHPSLTLTMLDGALGCTKGRTWTALGQRPTVVYAYGYCCAPDRLKVGLTVGDTVQRIAAQIGTSTPDKPMLLLEIRTHDCSSLERAIHAILEYRGLKIAGGGKEWFRT